MNTLKNKIATAVRGNGGDIIVQYHNTDVVRFDGGRIVLNTGGWFTATTKKRMNQASTAFELNYNVYVDGGVWYVKHNEDVIQFNGDVVVLTR